MKQTRNRRRHIINKGQYNFLIKITAFLIETTERFLIFVLMLNETKKVTKKLI